MKPIETAYAGRRFRSRLEARWAVFYSTLEIPWVYEPEGFVLTDGLSYLPDFYLPHLKSYVEIKPDLPSELEQHKANQLAVATSSRVFIFFGQPGFHIDGGYPLGQVAGDSAYLYDGTCINDGLARWDNLYTWCVCRPCRRFGIEYMGRSERLACRHCADHAELCTSNDEQLLLAYDEANRARF